MIRVGFVHSLSNSRALGAKTNLRMQWKGDGKGPKWTRADGFCSSQGKHNIGKTFRQGRVKEACQLFYISGSYDTKKTSNMPSQSASPYIENVSSSQDSFVNM